VPPSPSALYLPRGRVQHSRGAFFCRTTLALGTVGAAWRCGGLTERGRLQAALIALVAEDALIVEAQAEVTRYLSKEFEAAELVNRLIRLVDGPRPTSSATARAGSARGGVAAGTMERPSSSSWRAFCPALRKRACCVRPPRRLPCAGLFVHW
jgi:hypothetical protein